MGFAKKTKRDCLGTEDDPKKLPLASDEYSPGIVTRIAKRGRHRCLLLDETSLPHESVELIWSATRGEGYGIQSTIVPDDEDDVTLRVRKEDLLWCASLAKRERRADLTFPHGAASKMGVT